MSDVQSRVSIKTLGRILAIAVVSGSALPAQPISFISRQFYLTNSESVSMEVGDFNNDGKPDVALIDTSATEHLTILMNDGTGAFRAPVSYPIGPNSLKVVKGDFDRDGKLDLAIMSLSGIQTYMGKGDGMFTAGPNYAVSNASAMAIGDINGDGKLDIATLSNSYTALSLLVFAGNGDGTFQAPVTSVVETGQIAFIQLDLVLGYFNSDRKLDAAWAFGSTPGHTSVSFGNGDGTFQVSIRAEGGSSPMGLIGADFNNDGTTDLIVFDQYGPGLLLGTGTGSFQPMVYVGGGNTMIVATAADVNHDGRLDLIVADGYNQKISVLLGHGDGTFASAISYPNYPTPCCSNYQTVAVADVDGDGNPDILISWPAAPLLAVFHGNGDGSFRVESYVQSGASSTLPTATLPTADFNRDGIPDLLIGEMLQSGASQLSVMLGNGDGTFHGGGTVPVSSSTSYDSGDFFGNGTPGLVLLTNSQLSVLPGRGDGTFSAAITTSLGSFPGSNVKAIDLNHDGKQDLIIYGCCSLGVALSKGDGTFSTPVLLDQRPMVLIDVADINGDGYPDVIAKLGYGAQSFYWVNRGDGTFQTAAPLDFNPFNADATFGDLNGDGKADMVTVPTVTPGGTDVVSATVRLGNGDGTFQSPIPFTVPAFPADARFADLNGDGKQDVVISNFVWPGNGDGTFGTPVGFGITNGRKAIAIADFNRDAKADVAILVGDGSVAMMLNGSGSSKTATHFSVTAPARVTAGVPFNFTVTALDANNNVVSSYSGTVHVTSTDGSALLPSDSKLTSGTGTFSATFHALAVVTFTATDTVTPAITGSSGPVAVYEPATHLGVVAPASVTSGVPFSFYVAAQGASGAISGGYTGTVHFTSTDPSASLPADATLVYGSANFQATFNTAGSQSITATDTVSGSINGSSGPVTVTSGPATHFSVIAPASAAAGAAFTLTITALDAANRTVTTYGGVVYVTSTDASAALPSTAILSGGVGTFSATLNTPGAQTIIATDSVSAGITGTSGTIAVSAAAATHFAVSAPSTAVSGVAFAFTVTALDASNRGVAGYAGTVHFTSTDGSAGLPANATLTNGSGMFQATLNSAGNQSITATDASAPSVNGMSGVIAVSSAPATHFGVTAASSVTSGVAFGVTVTALTAANTVATSYGGTVHFTSTDSSALLPADRGLTNGTGSFQVTLNAIGLQSITAKDTVSASTAGTSAGITVSAAPATHFSVSAPASATSGVVLTFTITAQDATNHTVAGYNGTIHFTSSDTAAILPANATLANGSGSFQATLNMSGIQTIAATDVASAINGSSGGINVGSGPATHLSVSVPAAATAGAPIVVTVTARDGANNIAAGYSGTVRFSSTDGAAVLPGNAALTNGSGVFQAVLNTQGSQTLTATDTATASISGTSGQIVVSMVAGVPGAVSVTASGNGNGTSTSLTVSFSDTAGYLNLHVVDILINNVLDGRHACYIAFTPTGPNAGSLFLVDDAGDSGGPYAGTTLPGNGTVQNSQCTVGGSAAGIGPTLTLALNVTFAGSFSGGKVVYVAAGDLSGANTNWQPLGTWTVPGNTASGPSVAGMSPLQSSGLGPTTYSFTFTDPGGFQDGGSVENILINGAIDGRHACFLAFQPGSGSVFLVDDAGDGGGPFQGLVLPSNGTISNSQCAINGSGSSVARSGSTLVLTLSVAFSQSFAGNQVFYLAARSSTGNSGWQAAGSVAVR